MEDKSRRLRVGFIGCGGHSWRNVYPALQFAPVELVATCDLKEERAKTFARQFGALRWYANHHEMLEKEDLEGVFIVTGYTQDRRPNYPPLVIDCLRAGCHVWLEKPPASSVAEVGEMTAAAEQAGRFFLVGFKKAFTPTATRAKEIIARPEFGGLTHLYCRYPQAIPTEAEKREWGFPMLAFLDHIVHPASLMTYLAGPPRRLTYRRQASGGGFALIEFESGALGCLHLAAGQSFTGPLERLEVIGKNANLVVDNGVRLTYYRPGGRGPGGYGGATDFMGDDAGAPIFWEPEFSLGQLYNKQLFLLGYAPEVREFAECALSNTPPTRGGPAHTRQVMQIFEAFLPEEGGVVEMG
jgi:predicted dehydrogenase